MLASLKYSFYVFLGACSYGILSVIVKLAYQQGFTVSEVIGSQYLFGFIFVLIPFLFMKKVFSLKDVAFLCIAGITTSLTGLLYGKSLETIPASLAVILLFQFTWIGILIEAIANRRLPSISKLISILVLFLGTLLAGGVFSGPIEGYTLSGLIYGLLAAFSFALFIFVSGRIATQLHSLTRSFFMSLGALIFLFIIISPEFIVNGALGEGLWKYGSLLGFFGVLLPVLLFSIGTPKIGEGLATILGAAELPTAIIASVLILHEAVTWVQVMGIMVIIIGIAIPQINTQSKKQPLIE